MATDAGRAKKRKRPNRSAADRREQYDRAHARVAQTLVKGFLALNHRGCRRTKLGDALPLLLSTQPADHGAEDSKLYASTQPWQWQWWPQAYEPWPQGPWHPEQVPLEVPVPVQTSNAPQVAAPSRSDLGPAQEDLESNWSFSCTSFAPDGRFCRLTSLASSSSCEDTALGPKANSPPVSLHKTADAGDSRESGERQMRVLAPTGRSLYRVLDELSRERLQPHVHDAAAARQAQWGQQRRRRRK